MPNQDQHPDFERLLKFAEKALLPTEMAEVADHLAGCSDCARTIQRIERLGRVLTSGSRVQPSERSRQEVLRAFRRAPHIKQPPKSVIAQLVFDSLTMSPAVGLRSGVSEVRQLLYTTDVADLDLSVSETGEGLWTIIGQALPKGSPGSISRAVIMLIVADKVIAQTSASELGEFVLLDVPTGTYTLVMLTPDLRVEVPEVLL